MMRFRRAMPLLLAAALATGGLTAAPAHAAGGTGLTEEQIGNLGPDEQTALLAPLRQLADAVAGAGDRMPALYGGVKLYPTGDSVYAYLTDLSLAGVFRDKVATEDARADLSRLRIAQARYTRQDLLAASEQLRAQPEFANVTVGVSAEADALHLEAENVPATEVLLAQPEHATTPAVATVVEQGSASVDTSRTKDAAPWKAGALLNFPAGYCTSGIPTRRNSDNHSFLITAAHCGKVGDPVYSGYDGNTNYVGTAYTKNYLWDAMVVDTGSTGPTTALEWDGPPTTTRTFPLSGVHYSREGDYVCHDGYFSGVVCGIRVTIPDYYWTGEDGVGHRGVRGQQVSGHQASQGGDSGGLVFGVNGSVRDVRGIVSGHDSNQPARMHWTEAIDIFNSLKLHLP